MPVPPRYGAYTSDGEEPTRVYQMYRDENGDWQVSINYVDLEFVDFFFPENPVGPSLWDEGFQEVKKYYTTVQGLRVKKSAGFRYSLRIEWPVGSLDNRGDIVGIANVGVGTRFRVYPHNDNTLVHFDCTISDSNVTARYHADGRIRHPAYSPMIEFAGVYLVPFIPHNISLYHYFLIDKTAWGAYTVPEQQRMLMFIDKAQWALYTDAERRYFTRKRLERGVPD